MVIKDQEINVENFLTNFKKSFSNFCTRAPLFLASPYYMENRVILYSYKTLGDSSRKKLFEYDFDYSLTVKENIREIKKILINEYYPSMIEIYEEEVLYSPEKLNYLIEEGKITLDDITPKGGIIKKTKIIWRLEKIIVDNDTILLRNLNNNKFYKASLRMPVTTFLKKILNEIEDQYERWELFNRKKNTINLFYEVDKDIKKWVRSKIQENKTKKDILSMYKDCLEITNSKIDKDSYIKIVQNICYKEGL